MNGFDYVRDAHHYYLPRTPRAALKAMEEGLLPAEAYVYKATSVKPLNEEPVDVPEVERILSRENNDLETNLLLVSILDRLLGNQDPEVALFAAESINAIENRYNARIQAYKEQLSGDDPASARRGLARQFYELARINDERPAIRRFYLTEGYGYLKDLYRNARFTRADLELAVEVLLSLGLPDRARFILERIEGPIRDDPDVLLLRARVEFHAKEFTRVSSILEYMKRRAPWVKAREQEILKLWSDAFHA